MFMACDVLRNSVSSIGDISRISERTATIFFTERSITSSADGKAATGLVLASMVFRDGVACGIKYEMGSQAVELVGVDLKSGNQVVSVRQTGYEAPEACVEPSWCENCVTVRIQDGNKFGIWRVDVRAGKIAQKTSIQCYGRFGNYGEVSAVWQGPYQALWAFENRKFVRSAP